MKLSELKPGESARITKVGGSGSLRQHFLDMGLIPDAFLTLIKLAPMGDPMELLIHGYELTLRLDDAKKIEINAISDQKIKPQQKKPKTSMREHPGFGEYGKFHIKETERFLFLNR